MRFSDGKIQARGLLPGQRLVQMPDGKLKVFSQPTTVQKKQPQQQLQPVQQQQQKVQIVRYRDGKIQARGLLPGQQLVQMPDGKLKVFSQPTTVQQQQLQQQQPQVQQRQLVTLQPPVQNQPSRRIIAHPSGSTLTNTMTTPFSVIQNRPKILPNTTNWPQGQGTPQQPKSIVATPLQPGQPITPGTTVFMSVGKTYCIQKASMLAQQQQRTLSQEKFNNNAIKTEQSINNDSKVKVKSIKKTFKKAKKRKIETSSDSEDYEEKYLVQDKSDGSIKMKNIQPFLDSDPLTFSQFNNNDMKTEESFQESEEEIKSEKFDSDLEIKNDVNAELADDESEEIPILEVRIDLNKQKGTTDRAAASSRKNKKKE